MQVVEPLAADKSIQLDDIGWEGNRAKDGILGSM